MDYNIDDMKDLITDRFSFRDLKERDLLYIDKTEYIFRLVSSPRGLMSSIALKRRAGHCPGLQASMMSDTSSSQNQASLKG